MKGSIGCRELGFFGCTFEVSSESQDEIKDALISHTRKYHPSNLSAQEHLAIAQMVDEKLEALFSCITQIKKLI